MAGEGGGTWIRTKKSGFGDPQFAIELMPPVHYRGETSIVIDMLFFCFLVRSVFTTPLAIFFKFQFPLHFLFVFAGPIVNALAYGALHFDKVILTHDLLKNYFY